MRLFFLMLLLFNGVFFVLNAIREPKTTTTPPTLNNSIPQLLLLVEKSTQDTKTKEPSPNKEEEPSLDLTTWLAKFTAETEEGTQSTQNNTEDNIKSAQATDAKCYTAGPFQTSENLSLASDFFKNSSIRYHQRSIIENQYIGMLVYIPSQVNRKTVVAMAETLAAQGVKDYMLLNEPGKKHSLSLGVYGLKKNAAQRIKTLSKLNYKAKSEARYRKKTIYWLDYELDDSDEQTILSAQQMKSLNVSQIQRNCKS